MLPEAAFDGVTELIDQVTVWFEAPVTVAVNCCCWPALKLTLCGLMLTVSELPPKNTPLTTADVRISPPSSLAERVSLLAEESFFTEPKSLSDIQAKLAEHGWHYPQTNLSTPLIRLVRQRRLRRLQLAVGNKRVWKYALP
jgi:hypothetical protein